MCICNAWDVCPRFIAMHFTMIWHFTLILPLFNVTAIRLLLQSIKPWEKKTFGTILTFFDFFSARKFENTFNFAVPNAEHAFNFLSNFAKKCAKKSTEIFSPLNIIYLPSFLVCKSSGQIKWTNNNRIATNYAVGKWAAPKPIKCNAIKLSFGLHLFA